MIFLCNMNQPFFSKTRSDKIADDNLIVQNLLTNYLGLVKESTQNQLLTVAFFNLVRAHLFSLRERQKRGPRTLQTRD